jgi:hypothetical protein
VRQSSLVDRDLQPGVAQPGAEVPPVQRQEFLTCDPAEPEERRQRGCGQVIGCAAGDVEEGFLEHVGRVDPPLQAVVDAQPDDVLQPLAMAGEQGEQGLVVPVLDALLKPCHDLGFARHDLPLQPGWSTFIYLVVGTHFRGAKGDYQAFTRGAQPSWNLLLLPLLWSTVPAKLYPGLTSSQMPQPELDSIVESITEDTAG